MSATILSFEKNNKGEVSCVVAKDRKGKHTCKDLRYWSGFEFRSARQGGASVSYDTLLSQQSFRDHFNSSNV